MTLPQRPSGDMPGSHTRAWVEYRRQVREAAARWCDRPQTTAYSEGGVVTPVADYACGECDACRAMDLVLAGEV